MRYSFVHTRVAIICFYGRGKGRGEGRGGKQRSLGFLGNFNFTSYLVHI